MSIYSWVWFAIFGLGCCGALAFLVSFWFLALLPLMYFTARAAFWSPW